MNSPLLEIILKRLSNMDDVFIEKVSEEKKRPVIEIRYKDEIKRFHNIPIWYGPATDINSIEKRFAEIPHMRIECNPWHKNATIFGISMEDMVIVKEYDPMAERIKVEYMM